MDKILTKVITGIYRGHVVNCKDIDGGDEFNVEVFVLDSVTEPESIAEDAAEKHELCKLSGNSFLCEYIQPSGKVIRKTVTTTREVLEPATDEAEKLLTDGFKMG